MTLGWLTRSPAWSAASKATTRYCHTNTALNIFAAPFGFFQVVIFPWAKIPRSVTNLLNGCFTPAKLTFWNTPHSWVEWTSRMGASSVREALVTARKSGWVEFCLSQAGDWKGCTTFLEVRVYEMAQRYVSRATAGSRRSVWLRKWWVALSGYRVWRGDSITFRVETEQQLLNVKYETFSAVCFMSFLASLLVNILGNSISSNIWSVQLSTFTFIFSIFFFFSFFAQLSIRACFLDESCFSGGMCLQCQLKIL